MKIPKQCMQFQTHTINVTFPWSHGAMKPGSHRATEPQSHGATEPQSHGPTESQVGAERSSRGARATAPESQRARVQAGAESSPWAFNENELLSWSALMCRDCHDCRVIFLQYMYKITKNGEGHEPPEPSTC